MTRIPQPGEVSLAHGGTLFLDEWPEFTRAVRENLPAVLNMGHVRFYRVGGYFAYPADPSLVIARVTHAQRDDPRAVFAGSVDVEIPAQVALL